ncbi:MHC class II transactivator isoform X2 [Nerophis ophidion]|uniref:MHC class II transactivator isoform X2 n=1 Tax=Nerophis ophidion TaxID=159077 RepID=UPI002ADF8A77|nr:MHC class II transactivator isoform X2 [Nerophis ophidion]XP_061761853.1 MHC class II transactivator isoform X2 [Nerophis ophidion]
MQEAEQNSIVSLDDGDLPDDLSEFMNDSYLVTTVDRGSLFGDDHLLTLDEELNNPSDTHVPTQRGSNQEAGLLKPIRENGCCKRPGASQRKAAIKKSRAENEGPDPGLMPSHRDPTSLSTPPTSGLPLSSSVPFFTFPHVMTYPVIRLPLPGVAAPTYILVHSSCQLQPPPSSPEEGPGDESTKVQPCPPTIDVPQSSENIKIYIQMAKAHMNRTCEEMEAGLRLTSHYVDAHVFQRETFGSRKNMRKCINKQLKAIGDIDRQKRLLKLNEIFENSSGEKPKRYILLLGNAGMGKTTLIKKLCQDWSRDRLPQFEFLFLLSGKAVTLPEPSFSLQTLLLDNFTSVPAGIDAKEVYTQILASPKRVLVVFDGFDELRDYDILFQGQEKDYAVLEKDIKTKSCTMSQLYAAILQRILLPGCTILLSARPKGTAYEIMRRLDCLLEISGFTLSCIENYFFRYFSESDLREYAIKRLEKSSYLRHLCWNPGLCRLVCLVLEHSNASQVLPRTITELCHQVLCIKMKSDIRDLRTQDKDQTKVLQQSTEKDLVQVSSKAKLVKRKRGRKEKWDKETDYRTVGGPEERVLLSQLSYWAWEGVKASSSILPAEVCLRLKTFGLRWGLFLSYQVRARPVFSSSETEEGVGAEKEVALEREEAEGRSNQHVDLRKKDLSNNLILLWANPFLQCYLAGVHMSLSRNCDYNYFIRNILFGSGSKRHRRVQREVQELTRRFVVGIAFLPRTQHRRLHLDINPKKLDLVTRYLWGLHFADLTPGQILEACHYVFESEFSQSNKSGDNGEAWLVGHLVANLPEALTFHSVQLSPPDVYTVQKILEKTEHRRKRFSLDLQNTGIQTSGIRSLVGLGCCSTYRACIADVIALWEQLEQSGERGLLKEMVTKFQIHPLKVMQVCQIDHLAKLVNIHINRRLSDCLKDPDPILEGGVPAIKGLRKLEFELGPERGPLAIPKLWEFLPNLQDLQHLDLEDNKIGDEGAEKLADALASLSFLEVLNLSQNYIGDKGVRKLVTTLKDLPNLHCLILYSNVISDQGASSLSTVLPHLASLTDLDVKYNKLSDVGVECLAVKLRECKQMKTLRMWNQSIPFRVFERLQLHDSRILWQ